MRFEGVGTLPNMSVDMGGISVLTGLNDTGKTTVLRTAFCILDPASAVTRELEAEDALASDVETDGLASGDGPSLETGSLISLIGSDIESEFGGIGMFRSFGRWEESSVTVARDGRTSVLTADSGGLKWTGPFDDLPRTVFIDSPSVFEGLSGAIPSHRSRLASMANGAEVMDVDPERLGPFMELIDRLLIGGLDPTYGPPRYQSGKRIAGVAGMSAGAGVFSLLRLLVGNGAISRETVVLMDCPESNLHPAWQAALGEAIVFLRSSIGCSIVMATHSPLLLRAVQAHSASAGEKVRFYDMWRDESGRVRCTDLGSDPEQAFGPMADAYELVENLFLGGGRKDREDG